RSACSPALAAAPARPGRPRQRAPPVTGDREQREVRWLRSWRLWRYPAVPTRSSPTRPTRCTPRWVGSVVSARRQGDAPRRGLESPGDPAPGATGAGDDRGDDRAESPTQGSATFSWLA